MSKKSAIRRGEIQDDTLIIREAQPDLDEGLIAARFVDEASEGFFKSILGIKTYEIIADAFVKSNNEYSFENSTMIECEGRVVGMISGYTSIEKEGFTKNVLNQFPRGAKFRILIFSVIGRLLSRFLGPHGKEDYYLQTITVNSGMRGKGIGQILLRHSEEIAIEKGAKILSLDVSSKNYKAINSYLRFGMRATSSWPNFLKLPPVFTRMEKEL